MMTAAKFEATPAVSVEPEMTWIPWSEKSKNTLFKSSVTGVGDGELKMADEFGTTILGQNSPYDMTLTLNGIKTKCDVKKLDAQDDFNTGREGRDALRPVKMLHTILLDSLEVFAKSDVFTPGEKGSLAWFHDKSPDELAVGTLKKLEAICSMLSEKKKKLRSTLPAVSFTAHSCAKEMPLDLFYLVCHQVGLAFPVDYASHMETIMILQKMDHIYIDEPTRFMKDLDALVHELFTEITLVIVHEEKGYKILQDPSIIKFYRITRGNPRFKVLR